jgi:hypothetical protein
VLRDAQGRVMPVALFQADGGSTPSAASTAQDAGAGSGWHYRIGGVALEGIDLSYADATLSPALSYETRIDSLALRDLDSRSRSPGTFDARVGLAEGGRLDANGKLRLDPLLANARVQLSQFDLRPLQPLLARVAALELKGGSGSADAAVNYRSTAQGVALQASGQVAVAELQIDEAQSGAPFLAWKHATAELITYSHAARRLEIGNVRISRPRGKLEISEDRKLNVLQVLKSRPAGQASGRPARTPNTGQAQTDVPFAFRVDRLRLVDGTLHFADRSLVLPFERDIESFDATVVNLSSRPSTRARLEANGRIAPYGVAKASGDIDFSSPRDFTDIRAQFSNVRLPPLSPYTLTFAGRAIAAGTLWLDVRYRILDGELQGSNEVTIEDLELGERVEERTALNIPLDLAVALLTDEQGRFRISVPVRGDLDNPSFDYGQVIRTAITDTLRRVVTAPFRFIGRLFGGGGESLDAIAFQPGSAALTPPQQDKLNTVAKALAERPQVALVVQPGFAPEADARALREARVKRELAQRAGLRLRPGEDPGPVAFSNQRVQRAIARMAEERLGRDALGRGAGGEDEGFYEMLYERLVAAQPLATDPRELAQQRTQSIVEYLLRTGEVERERVAPADPRQVQATEDAVETELRLKAGGG